MALTVAVTALTAVGFFTDRVRQAVAVQASEVLAADLRLQSSSPLSETYAVEARGRGLFVANTLSTLSVVFFGEKSQLANVRMVGKGYPLRGRVKIAEVPFG